MTVAIVSIGVVGLMAALGVTFHLGSVSRVDTQGDALLMRYAENVASQPYESCTVGTAPYAGVASSAIPASNLPDGVTVGPPGSGDGTSQSFELGIEATTYWNGDTFPITFSAACPASDLGAEQLHLFVRSGDDAFERRLTLVKRRA